MVATAVSGLLASEPSHHTTSFDLLPTCVGFLIPGVLTRVRRCGSLPPHHRGLALLWTGSRTNSLPLVPPNGPAPSPTMQAQRPPLSARPLLMSRRLGPSSGMVRCQLAVGSLTQSDSLFSSLSAVRSHAMHSEARLCPPAAHLLRLSRSERHGPRETCEGYSCEWIFASPQYSP